MSEFNNMQGVEEDSAQGSNTTAPPLNHTPLLINTPDTNKFAELPATKAMKTHVKNLISKYSRLQDRLLKYNALIDNENDAIDLSTVLKDENAVKAAKKFYQFRLLDIQSIRKDTLAEMDKVIAGQVVLLLLKDVQSDLNDIVTKVSAAPETLRQELTDYKNKALGMSLISEQDKQTYGPWWDQQITHNINKLNIFVMSCKAGATSAVSVVIDLVAKECHNICNNILFGDLGAPLQYEVQGPHNSKPTYEKEPAKKKGRSQRRRQQRRSQKREIDQSCEGNGIPQKGRTQGPEKARKQKVFVNVHLDRNIEIPSIVFRTLNLGANFQLASFPQARQIWQDWEKSKDKIVQKTTAKWEEKQGQKQGLNSFLNIVAAVNDRCIYNFKYINKALRCDKGLRTAVNINNAMRTVFNFLKENNLFVILADKNLGLTIVDEHWYDLKMREHFINTDAFSLITDWHSGAPGRNLTYMPYVTKAEFALRTCVFSTSFMNRGQAGIFMEKHWKWENCVVPQSYGLIKLHKEPRKLRYITPVTQWVNVLVAKWVVSYLQPYVDKMPTVLSSSKNFIPILEKCNARSLWVGTWDITDMYNRIDQDESIFMINLLACEKGWCSSSNRDNC